MIQSIHSDESVFVHPSLDCILASRTVARESPRDLQLFLTFVMNQECINVRNEQFLASRYVAAGVKVQSDLLRFVRLLGRAHIWNAGVIEPRSKVDHPVHERIVRVDGHDLASAVVVHIR